MKNTKTSFRFHLRGKTAVFIDWANVHGWEGKLKWEVSPKKLFKYLKTYPQIKNINFYFGVEKGNEKSEKFQKEIKKIGYELISKEVKWVPVNLEKYLKEFFAFNKIPDNFPRFVMRRKCDFDFEIALDCFEKIDKFDSFLFFSGDGDFETLYRRLIKKDKQVIAVFAPYHLGKEIRKIQTGIYLCAVDILKNKLK